MVNQPSSVERSPRQRVLRCVGWMVFVLSPFLLLLLISLFLGENALDAYPVWLDELCDWRSLFSWDAAGFQTGYYGMLEETARFGTLGISGLGPVLIYGWFIKLFGLTHNSIMLCNALWISIAALVLCAVRKPKPAVSFALTAFTLLYAPAVLYCTTSMTEWFNYALVLFYVTFLLAYQEKRTIIPLLLCCLTVLFGCLYRPMYAVLFIPMVLFFCRYRFGWRMIVGGMLALGLSVLCAYLDQLAAAPNAQGFVHQLLHAADVQTGFRMLLSHAKANLIDFFIRPTHSPMQDAFRHLYCGTTLLCLTASFVRTQKQDGKWHLRVGYRGPLMGCFLLLVAAWAFTVLFYETNDWQDFRRLAPYLWLVVAYMIARHRITIPAVTLAACAVTLCLLIASPEGAFLDEHRFREPEAPESLPEIAQAIVYDATATDPFHNTVRADVASYPLMEALDPGMGLQYGWFTTETTGQSRWILTDQLKCPVSGYENVLNTGDFKLYRQIDAPKED